MEVYLVAGIEFSPGVTGLASYLSPLNSNFESSAVSQVNDNE